MKKNKILVVEDEESMLKLETVLLTVKGFDVVGAFTGRMALDKLSEEDFDLVLLDIMLPDIDGFEVCQFIRNNPRTAGIPVVMLSAKKTQEDYDRGVLCGANAYLTKPFKSAAIVEEIKNILSKAGTGL